MKKYSFVVIILIGLLMNALPALAAGKAAIVTAQDMVISDDETTLIPVTISDNPGIMGFRITIEYPSDLVDITNVTAGSVTTNGSFMFNSGKNNNQIDVIWFSSDQSVDNGTLFVLTAKSKPLLKQSATITLSYSQKDTFNEQYEDVELDCRSFKLVNKDQTTATQVATVQATTTQLETTQASTQASMSNTTTSKREHESVSDSQIISAVDVAVQNTDVESIDDFDESFLNEVNRNLKTIVGIDADEFESVDELKQQYKKAIVNEYVAKVQVNKSSEKISETINESLKKNKASSISELSPEEINVLFGELDDFDSTQSDAFNSLSLKEKISALQELQDGVDSSDDSQKSSESNWITVLIVIFFVISLGISSAIIMKRWIKQNKQNEG